MRTFLAAAFIAFPLAVYFLPVTTPRVLVITLFGLLAGLRVLLAKQLSNRQRGLALALLGAFCLLAGSGPELVVLKIYPMLINLAGAGFGIYTLLHPPSAIERIARASGMAVDAAGARYTRAVTKLWIVFFIGNGIAAAYTALFCSTAIWSLYNGVLSYCLVALLFTLEYGFRLVYRRRQDVAQ